MNYNENMNDPPLQFDKNTKKKFIIPYCCLCSMCVIELPSSKVYHSLRKRGVDRFSEEEASPTRTGFQSGSRSDAVIA